MQRSLIFVLASAAVLAFVAPATARETHARVSYADLNLSNPQDAQTMLDRISDTARQVCKVTGRDSLDAMVMQRDCTRETVARTVARLNSPTVTALYRGRSGVQYASLR
ncbi:MAG TPA: UrcA family protein [Caulobacterales bacterium]|nr:UrcA family protein [Caulobacterales bacterium]